MFIRSLAKPSKQPDQEAGNPIPRPELPTRAEGLYSIALLYFPVTKPVALSDETYRRLKQRKRTGESFSQVVLRAHWDEETVTAKELLERWKNEPPFFSDEELAAVEEAKAGDRPPVDKWKER
jgi:predicted CopG family antitoxin